MHDKIVNMPKVPVYYHMNLLQPGELALINVILFGDMTVNLCSVSVQAYISRTYMIAEYS